MSSIGIVISCDQDDKCWVLQPSPINRAQIVPAYQTSVLEPIRASVPSQEKLIVYGFPEERDFQQFAPIAGNLNEAASAAYVEELESRLAEKNEISTERWVKAEAAYVIVAHEETGEETTPKE